MWNWGCPIPWRTHRLPKRRVEGRSFIRSRGFSARAESILAWRVIGRRSCVPDTWVEPAVCTERMFTVLETRMKVENVHQQKGIRPCCTDFGANKSRSSKAPHTEKSVLKIRVRHSFACNTARQKGMPHIISREWMEESVTGFASSLAWPRQNWPAARNIVSRSLPAASGMNRRDLLLWQSSRYGYQDRMEC